MPPEIQINSPFRLVLNPQETEDRLGSMRMEVNFSVPFLGSQISYSSNDLWFGYDQWDAWISGLKGNQTGEEVVLTDLSESFMLKGRLLNDQNSTLILAVHLIKDKTTNGNIHCTFELNRDELAEMAQQFRKFPKWW